MAGSKKIDYAKKSANLLIDNLIGQDKLSLITFSGTATLVSEMVPMTEDNKQQLKAKVQRCSPGGGGTNISSTLITAFDVARDIKDERTVNRVIFLTDGCATSGVTDSSKLIEIAKGVPQNTLITAMGFGEVTGGRGWYNDLDVDFLEELSETGVGNYYYMKDADTCRSSFANELAGLISSVANDVEITITPKDGRLEILEVLDDIDVEESDGAVKVVFSDIISEQQRRLLVKCKTVKQDRKWERKAAVADIHISYKDVEEAKTSTIDISAKLGFVKEDAKSPERHPDVESYYAVLKVLKAQEKAFEQAEIGDLEGARSTLWSAHKITSDLRGLDASHTHTLEEATSYYASANDYSNFKGDLKGFMTSGKAGKARLSSNSKLGQSTAQAAMDASFEDAWNDSDDGALPANGLSDADAVDPSFYDIDDQTPQVTRSVQRTLTKKSTRRSF